MSVIKTIILKVVLNRIINKIKPEVAEEQYGFTEGKGTMNAILKMCMITEIAIVVHKDVYMCFIDYEKAFDKVQHSKPIEILKNIIIDTADNQPLLGTKSCSKH